MRALLLLLAALALVAAAAGCRSTSIFKGDFELAFSGNESFADDELRDAIREDRLGFGEERLTRIAADDAAYAIELHYRRHGFPFPEVEYEWAEGPEGVPRATFRIREGVRTRIGSFRITGDPKFSDLGDEELASFFADEDGELPEDGEQYYVESRLSSQVASLRSFYYWSGFLESRVSDPVVEFDEGRTEAQVVVEVDKGPRFELQGVDFEGELEIDRGRLEREVKNYLRRPYTRRVAFAIRARLIELYGHKGYPDCTVELDAELDPDGAVALRFQIEPGPRVRVVAIDLEGNETTRSGYVRSRLEFDEGDRYDGEDVRASFRNLYRTGLFERIRFDLEEGDAEERKMTVVVQEAPSLEVYAEPGYGSYEGPRIEAGVTERNLFGTGKAVRVAGNVSLKAHGARGTITNPFFLGTDLTATGTIFYNRREEPSFTFTEIGTGAGLSRQWTDAIRTSLDYEFRLTTLSDVDLLDPDAQDIVDDVDIASLTLAVSHDTRSDVFVPESGNFSRVSLEWADPLLASEIGFLAARLTEAQFVHVASGTVLAFALRTGVIAPIAGTDEIPLQERYFNGGENTVRSFEEDELGPRDTSGDPLGGEAFTVFSAEVRQRLVGNLQGALFYDLGNVASDFGDYLSFEGLESGVGVGLRYLLPIGPLRVDWALNPDPDNGADDWVIHFSVGMAF